MSKRKFGVVLGSRGIFWAQSPTARPDLTLIGAQAHGQDQHPAAPSALHAVPELVLWPVPPCASPRLRNLGSAGRSSENRHLRRAITTPLSLCLDYKIITSMQGEGGTGARQVFPGGQNQPDLILQPWPSCPKPASPLHAV